MVSIENDAVDIRENETVVACLDLIQDGRLRFLVAHLPVDAHRRALSQESGGAKDGARRTVDLDRSHRDHSQPRRARRDALHRQGLRGRTGRRHRKHDQAPGQIRKPESRCIRKFGIGGCGGHASCDPGKGPVLFFDSLNLLLPATSGMRTQPGSRESPVAASNRFTRLARKAIPTRAPTSIGSCTSMLAAICSRSLSSPSVFCGEIKAMTTPP